METKQKKNQNNNMDKHEILLIKHLNRSINIIRFQTETVC